MAADKKMKNEVLEGGGELIRERGENCTKNGIKELNIATLLGV